MSLQHESTVLNQRSGGILHKLSDVQVSWPPEAAGSPTDPSRIPQLRGFEAARRRPNAWWTCRGLQIKARAAAHVEVTGTLNRPTCDGKVHLRRLRDAVLNSQATPPDLWRDRRDGAAPRRGPPAVRHLSERASSTATHRSTHLPAQRLGVVSRSAATPLLARWRARGVALHTLDVGTASGRALGVLLAGAAFLVSVCGARALDTQRALFAAAARAGVRRLVPSDFAPACPRGVALLQDSVRARAPRARARR
jgi:hypothetical protein